SGARWRRSGRPRTPRSCWSPTPRRWSTRWRTSATSPQGLHQPLEQVGELASLGGGELAEQVPLAGEQRLERAVDGVLAGRGQADEDAAAVARVGRAIDEPAFGQAIDPVGHRAAVD